MRASELLEAKSYSNGVVVLEGKKRNQIRILGGSVGQIPIGAERSNSQSFHMIRGDKGMIAVQVVAFSDSWLSGIYNYFLSVGWKENGAEPYVDLENQWIPQYSRRLGWFYQSTDVEVAVNGIVYSSSEEARGAKGKYYISDLNLICRYMDNKSELEDLKASAREYTEIEPLRVELNSCKLQVRTFESRCEDLRKERDGWKEVALRLKRALEKEYFKRRESIAALRDFPKERE